MSEHQVPQPTSTAQWRTAAVLVVAALLLAAVTYASVEVAHRRVSADEPAGLGDAWSRQAAEQTGVDEQVIDDAVEAIGGATVSGPLPAGWSMIREGMWADINGNNVNVIVHRADSGSTLSELVDAALPRLGQVRSISQVSAPVDTTRFGVGAKRVSYRADLGGRDAMGVQYFALRGGKLVIVTATIVARQSAQRTEVESVIDQLKLVR